MPYSPGAACSACGSILLRIGGDSPSGLIVSACSVGTVEQPAHGTARKARPNIVLILTDDLGYGDLGYHGNPVVSTPHIDRLATDSVRFTNFHVDPTCSPTRAALMTGKHSLLTGVWLTVLGRSLLPAGEVTMAELLRDHGYLTAIFGKWHLGDNYPFRPQDQGFDVAVVHGGGGVGQVPDYWGNTQFDDAYFHNGEPVRHEGYATTNAPHKPWRAPKLYTDPYLEQGVPQDVAMYYAMVTAIDDQVGRLRRELERLELADNTVLIFTSDNGSALLQHVKSHPDLADFVFDAGLRGAKGDVYEGGHRVPFFVWAPPLSLGEPRDIAELTAHTDVLPTLLDAVDAPRPTGIDGQSLLPLIQDGVAIGERSIVVTHQRRDIPRFGRPHVLMTEQWRYVRWDEEGVEELFDVTLDPGQASDVLERHPETAARLRQALADWWEDTRPANVDRQRIIVGNGRENPARLNPMDWARTSCNSSARIPFYPGFAEHRPDTEIKGWIGREREYRSLPWYLTVAETGRYGVSLYLHDTPAGRRIESRYAVLEVQRKRIVEPVSDGATFVTIGSLLEAGDTELRAWFSSDAEGLIEEMPAMYIYVEKLQ